MHTPQVVRRGPLSDADLLQVTYGCPWGRCRFCNLYEHEAFGMVPMAGIAYSMFYLLGLAGKGNGHANAAFAGVRC